ncbi:MAG TPA: gamma-glutamyltransferase, partial [Longimicrobiales bacterium]|nr:gamma-glutamyltransferase [Longimicrobiales bacterium]
MSRVAVATVSGAAARAGVGLARRGGNAVDVAVASGLAAVVTHPGMCSLGGGGFLTVWPAGGEPVTVDGGMEMPGRGLDPGELGRGGRRVELGYAGGVTTTVGAGSVATPGLLAACSLAVRRWGRLPWSQVLAPAVELARDGFPMPASSHAFLTHAHEAIYGHDPRSRAALHDDRGRLLGPGETVRVEALVETLELLAREGVE